MSSVEYDPTVIHTFAKRLYDRARSIIWSYGFLGFLVGAGFGGGMAAEVKDPGAGLGFMLVFGVIGAGLGAALGLDRAFVLKLQAQTALCQAQIEANTRQVLAMQTTRPAATSAPSLPESAMLRRASS